MTQHPTKPPRLFYCRLCRQETRNKHDNFTDCLLYLHLRIAELETKAKNRRPDKVNWQANGTGVLR